jgi:hypothetical protein
MESFQLWIDLTVYRTFISLFLYTKYIRTNVEQMINSGHSLTYVDFVATLCYLGICLKALAKTTKSLEIEMSRPRFEPWTFRTQVINTTVWVILIGEV